jgi:hypothetical protein
LYMNCKLSAWRSTWRKNSFFEEGSKVWNYWFNG